jgi:hypothetical protein
VDLRRNAGHCCRPQAPLPAKEIYVTNEIDHLGPKDFITGCLVIVVALVVVPLLVLIFKISIYLAIFIGIMVAVFLGVALLGRVIRLAFFGNRSNNQDRDAKNL